VASGDAVRSTSRTGLLTHCCAFSDKPIIIVKRKVRIEAFLRNPIWLKTPDVKNHLKRFFKVQKTPGTYA
jgi:hypothetical protein